ncbi:MAG: glycosyltransferase family A protein [Myxococcota bacterium]
MSAFNNEDTIAAAIESLLAQSYTRWELIAIDDASEDKTFDIMRRYSANDERICIRRNAVNRGTYWNRNKAIVLGNGEFITNLDADDAFAPDKLAKQIAALGAASACLCFYERPGRHAFHVGSNTMLFRRKVIDTIGYFDSVRYDADTEYMLRLGACFPIIQIPDILYRYSARPDSLTEAPETGVDSPVGQARRRKYAAHYRRWHRSETFPFVNFPPVRRPFALGHESQRCPPEPVVVSIATFPERRESLAQTLESIYPWVDRINLCLNEYESTPSSLVDDKIHVHIGGPDRGDAGKFLWSNAIEGYHFTCDDDIIYSRQYFEVLLTSIERYEREAIVGLHGSMLRRVDAPDFYSPQDRETITFRQRLVADRRVDFLGTGLMAYHTQHIHISPDAFPTMNMADVFLGIFASDHDIPLIQCASREPVVRDNSCAQRNSIYRHCLENKPTKMNQRATVNRFLAEAQWGDRTQTPSLRIP